MDALDAAKSWLQSAKPCTEEIKECIDNTCYLLAGSSNSDEQTALRETISFLISNIPGEIPEVVIPETDKPGKLDSSPLTTDNGVLSPLITPQERRERFERLKAGACPFGSVPAF